VNKQDYPHAVLAFCTFLMGFVLVVGVSTGMFVKIEETIKPVAEKPHVMGKNNTVLWMVE